MPDLKIYYIETKSNMTFKVNISPNILKQGKIVVGFRITFDLFF